MLKLLATLALVGCAQGHTLVTCTDLSDDLMTCSGYSRHDVTYMTGGSFNSGPTDGHIAVGQQGAPCDPTYWKDADYTAAFPMATAHAGQRMRIGWPSNNHQFADAAQGIPTALSSSGTPNTGDENVYVYHSTTGEFPARTIFDETPLATLPYSNCRKNYELALGAGGAAPPQFYCFGDIVMPEQPGKHTFVFHWTQVAVPTWDYATCWDVQVTAKTEDEETSAVSRAMPLVGALATAALVI
jgi:hypothetical protein